MNDIHPSVALCIEQLLTQHKKGHAVESQLDVQLTISLLLMYMQELFTTRVHVSADMLLHPKQVQDIGYIIRDIMLQKQQNDVLFKLYQYTMLFIKHSSLNLQFARRAEAHDTGDDTDVSRTLLCKNQKAHVEHPATDLQLLHEAHDVRQPARCLPVLSAQHLRASSGADGALYIFLLHEHAGRDEAAAEMHWLVLQPEQHQDFD